MAELNISEEDVNTPESILRIAWNHNLAALIETNLKPDDLRLSVNDKVQLIIACQAWRDGSSADAQWNSDWEDGHYMVVIGIDEQNLYFEDPAMPGTRGLIPGEESVSRWHDYTGAPQFNVNSTILHHAGIFIRGKKPAAFPVKMYVDQQGLCKSWNRTIAPTYKETGKHCVCNKGAPTSWIFYILIRYTNAPSLSRCSSEPVQL
jgi:predicted double-glycine peptidase